ncbi:MAG: energy-coupling factor transporter transmembrane protein EcfT [Gammaproteobacteria bacterium]|nr:energy-coupling factor transporter transmembrane protein EcfT [Gammaproteobacteria bacterium]
MKNIFVFIKLLFLFLITTALLLTRDWFLITLFMFLVFIVIILVKPQKILRQRVYPLFVIGALIILFQLLFNSSLSYAARIAAGIISTEKIITLSFIVLIFSATTSISQILSIFSFLPKRIQLAISMSFGILPAVIEEAHKIILIQNARGLNTKSLNIFKSIIPIIVPLFHRSFLRAERIAITLYSRGYQD